MDRPFLDLIDALTTELKHQHTELSVLRSAYLVMARQLDRRGVLPLEDLQLDVRMMGGVQPDEGWRDGHANIAALLNAMRDGR